MTALVAAAWCAVGLVWGLLLGFRWGRRHNDRQIAAIGQLEQRLNAIAAVLKEREQPGSDAPKAPEP